nr:MAG TPA: hypothetical protein [Caudoviricetes sp.]
MYVNTLCFFVQKNNPLSGESGFTEIKMKGSR